MSRIFFTLVVAIQFFYPKDSFSKVCSGSLTFDSIPYSYVDTIHYRLEIEFNTGETISFNASITGYSSQQCSCIVGPVYWYHDSSMFSGPTYNVVDTGIYTVNYTSNSWGGSCSSGWGSRIFHVYYNNTTTISEAIPVINLSVYPSLSTGIFNIKSAYKNFKQLFINDSAGRLILECKNNFSEIDLTGFSPGIYFYAITDEKENVLRGRIVKE